MTLEQILAAVHDLSAEEKIQLIDAVERLLSPEEPETDVEPTWTDEAAAALITPADKPFNGAEVVQQLRDGTLDSWADAGIEDSVAWLQALRRNRKRKFEWQ